MSPTLRPGDLVIDTTSGTPRPGTIVTFLVRQGGDSAVTHRVVGGTRADVVTKGDANASADPWQVPASDVVGRVAHRARYLGFVAVFLRQPAAVGSMFTGILSVVLVWSACTGTGTGTRQRPRRERAQRAPLYTA
jgi:signal peptidase I